MKKKGFTLVEILVVITIISILAALLLPTISGVQKDALRAKAKTTINQLAQALKAYETDYGQYPPDDLNNGGSETSKGTYKYRNDSLIFALDGDTSNGGPSIVYFEFQEEFIDGDSHQIYLDPFSQPFWYHNFHDDSGSTGKVRNNTYPLHPWYNRFHFRGVQLYTQADLGLEFPDDPYAGEDETETNFKWITNYTRN